MKTLMGSTIVAGSVMVATPVASAQDAEEIVVTGSRIQRVDVKGPSPVQFFDAEQISARGVTSVTDLLFGSASAGPGLSTENATLSQGAGTATFDARGFGAASTLVLVNGRRAPSIPLGGSAAVDINSLPFAAIERVEILNEGASAIYGSDAIGGVVNVITKSNYDGIDLTARAGMPDLRGGGGVEFVISGVGGVSSEKGSATLTVEYKQRDSIDASQRPLVRSALSPTGTDSRSPTGFPGTWVNGDFTQSIPFDGCPEERLNTTVFADAGQDCTYDFAPLYQVIPKTNSIKATAYLSYDIFDNVELYADLRGVRTFTEVRNGAAPAFFAVPGGEQGNPFPDTAFALRRQLDAGPRSRDARNWTLTGALGGIWDVNDNHSVEAYYQRSHVDMNQLGVGGNVSIERLEAAVESGDFLLQELNTPEVIASVVVPTFRDSLLDEDIYSLVASGFVPFDSFAGPIGYAAGVETRNSKFSDTVDQNQLDGDIAGGAASNGGGDRESLAVFGEVSVLPIESVELKGALRFDSFENGSGEKYESETYQLGASYSPTDWLTLRASTGTGFRAPSLGQLFLGRSFGVTRAVDTLRCDEARMGTDMAAIDNACRTIEIRSVSGGNQELQPEESESFNVGAVVDLDTSAMGNLTQLRMTLDYADITVENKIGSLSVQEILNNESEYASLVNRIGGGLSNPDAFVRSDSQNLSEENGQFLTGVFTTGYDAGNFGELTMDVRVNHLVGFERQSSAVQPLCEEAGSTSEAEWRSNVLLGWARDNLSANANIRYVGETEDSLSGRVDGTCDPAGTVLPVDSYTELALNGAVDINDTTKFTLGVTNVLDETPPYSEVAAGGWPWYDQALYSNIGRTFYVELNKKF